MAAYRCRAAKPRESDWRTVEADSPEDAAQRFLIDSIHEGLSATLQRRIDLGDGVNDTVHWCRVEAEGHGEWVARVFYSGILRRGRVKPYSVHSLPARLRAIAEALDWKGDPAELLAEGWDHEESEEHALARWGEP